MIAMISRRRQLWRERLREHSEVLRLANDGVNPLGLTPTYVGAIESCEEFGRWLYTEAWRRGWARVEKWWY